MTQNNVTLTEDFKHRISLYEYLQEQHRHFPSLKVLFGAAIDAKLLGDCVDLPRLEISRLKSNTDEKILEFLEGCAIQGQIRSVELKKIPEVDRFDCFVCNSEELQEIGLDILCHQVRFKSLVITDRIRDINLNTILTRKGLLPDNRFPFLYHRQMQRILVINNLYPPQELGGYGRSLCDFAHHLQQRGHDIWVLSSNSPYLGEIRQQEPNIDRRLQLRGTYDGGMKPITDPQILANVQTHNDRLIRETISRFKPDICLIGNIDFLGAEIFKPLLDRNIPIVHHMGFAFLNYPVSQVPRHPLYHLAAASNHVKERVLQKGYPDRDISVVYPGALVKQFQKTTLPTCDKLRIVYAGLLVQSKGPHTLLQALKLLQDNGIDFECSLAGDCFNADFVEQLKQFVANNQLSDRVKFLGLLSRQQLIDLYNTHNVLVFPSIIEEAFGITQVEAMAAGLTIITSGAGGASEIVEHGVSGLKFPAQDAVALAQRLASLLQNPQQWQNLSRAGRDRALQQFDIERSVDLLERKFQELSQQRNRAMPNVTNQSTMPPALDLSSPQILAQFQAALEAYTKNPGNSQAIEALKKVRFTLSHRWLNLPTEQLETNYSGHLGQIHRALWQSGIKNEGLTEEEANFVRQNSERVAAGFNSASGIGAFLVATLYSYPHQVSVRYQRAPIPNWLIKPYFEFMFESPRLFAEAGEVDAYYNYLTQWLGYLYTNIKNNLDNPVWQSVTSIFVEGANLTPLYFSANPNPVIPLTRVETERADILELYLKQKGCQLDCTFGSRPIHRTKIRLGILCHNFGPSAETFTGLPIFEHLDRTRFEVYLYSLATVDASAEQFVRDRADKCVDLAGNGLNQAVQTIRADDLDILFIGSNITARSYPMTLLSLHRLARVQTVSLAQPVTTGMRNIDYYIAGTLSIPPNPQSYYREKLVTIEGSGLCFRFGPERAATLNPDRASWGASPQTTIFISGANSRKINPKVRHTWAKILAAVPNSILVLYPFGPNWGRHPQLEKPFYDRMQGVLAQYGVEAKRLVLIRTLPSPADIRKCLELADIYLDSYPYSGAASALDPLRVNLPLVTMEGEEQRTRQSASLLRELQIRDLIARNEEEYIRLAVSLATNPQLRQQKRQQIQQQMQQSPPFLDSRAYGARMGVLFEKMVRGTAESTVPTATNRQTVESIPMATVSSYQSIEPAVKAIAGFLVPGQEKYLFDKVKSLPEDATIVEIGSFRGRSTVAMAYACVGTNRKIYCIDPWNFKGSQSFPENIYEIWTHNIQKNRLEAYVTPLRGYSRDILSRWSELTGDKKIDFIFIDGGHEYEDVLPDFQLAFPLVKPGGWLAFHDVRAGFTGVDRVWVENARVALTHHEFCSTIACGRKPAVAPTPSSPTHSPDLNRLLGCINLYQIDPTHADIVSELGRLRRQLAEYLLGLPTAQLETVYQGDIGNAYRTFLKSGFQTQPVPEADRPFVQQLTQQGAGFTHPQALNAFLGVMLYYAPGTMKVQNPQTRLPGWLVRDYLEVFEAETTPSPQPEPAASASEALSTEFLNRLLGCINLYEIDPSEPSIVSELHQLRRQLAEYWLNLPVDRLESNYRTEVGERYRSLLSSGFQKEPMNQGDRTFLQKLSQMAAGSVHPQWQNALLGAMLYYEPGKMKVSDARTRLPGWLIADYERVFEVG